MADFASRPHADGVSTFDELRRQLDGKCVNAVIRVDLKELIKEHDDHDFPAQDPRIKQQRKETNRLC